MDWDFGGADPELGAMSFGAVPDIALKDISLDLGSFISDFASPLLSKIDSVLSPLDWLLDLKDGLLFRRLPVISDLAGSAVSIKSLAEQLDPTGKIAPLMDAVAEIADLAQSVSAAAADARSGNLKIPFGDLVISSSDGNGGRTGLIADMRSPRKRPCAARPCPQVCPCLTLAQSVAAARPASSHRA